MNKLVFNNQGVANFQKTENGKIIDVIVEDISVKVGNGYWICIHCIAFYARTKEEQIAAANTIKLLCRKFPCETCRNHAKKYLKEHPIEKYINVKTKSGEKLGLFTWTWKFHNAVNHRLGKEIVPWHIAYEMYKNIDKDGEQFDDGSGSQCSACSEDKNKQKKYKYEKNVEEPYYLTEAKETKRKHKSK
jgi:hypothetical protein